MNKTIIILLACWSGLAEARVPPKVQELLWSLDAWKHRGPTQRFEFGGSNCGEIVEELGQIGIPDTLVVEMDFDTPYLKRGARTVAELEELCKKTQHLQALGRAVFFMRSAPTDQDSAVRCIGEYNKAIAAGWSPTTALPHDGVSFEDPRTGEWYSGTLEAARKALCDPHAKSVLEAHAKFEAPYRKVLKADKLDVAIRWGHKKLYGVGKKPIDRPKQLAANAIWFREYWYTDKSCGRDNRTPYVVVRYKFNAKHVLVDERAKNYCGEPPRSAFR